MAQIDISLDAYVIPDDHQVWKCFPGKTYRFYEIVRDTSVVFLDVRGLDALDTEPLFWADKEVLEIIAADRWSRELEKLRPGGKPKGGPDVSRTDRRTLTFLKGLLRSTKKGDLIALPAEGYRKEVLLGQILDEPGEVVLLPVKDGEKTYTYIGRRVLWRASQEKRFFSRDLIDLLHTQSAFFLLPKSLYEEMYRLAYENFIVGDFYAATFQTTKQHFSTSDSAVTGMWFNALASVREALERGQELDAAKTYFELGMTATKNEREGELAININSPGEYLLRSVGAFALVVMAMLPLTEVSAHDIINSDIKVHLKTIGSANDSCALKIDEAIMSYAKTLSVLRLQKHCEIGKRARAEATIKTKAWLNPVPEQNK